MPSINHTGRGRLIPLEGLNGVGKTYLTARVVAAADHDQPPLVVEGFSRRSDNDSDLGRRLLRTLVTASHGERFLRAGFPKSETLLLLAIKMHDFETTLPAQRRGSGRSGRSPRRRRLHRRAVAPAPPRRRTVRAPRPSRSRAHTSA